MKILTYILPPIPSYICNFAHKSLLSNYTINALSLRKVSEKLVVSWINPKTARKFNINDINIYLALGLSKKSASLQAIAWDQGHQGEKHFYKFSFSRYFGVQLTIFEPCAVHSCYLIMLSSNKRLYTFILLETT